MTVQHLISQLVALPRAAYEAEVVVRSLTNLDYEELCIVRVRYRHQAAPPLVVLEGDDD